MISNTYPNLNLSNFTRWKKIPAIYKFIPNAFNAITEKRVQPKITAHFVDEKNKIIGLSAGDLCYPCKFSDIERIGNIVVQFEDRRFYSHPGVDILSISRSIYTNIKARKIIRGGSTITQQLIRNTLLTPDKSFLRKALEIILALKFEKHYSKDEILFLYCQLVYLGNGIRGFSAAAKFIYRKPLLKLNSESNCGLIGLLRSPSIYNPIKNNKKFIKRQSFIINNYIKNDFLKVGSVSGPPIEAPNPINALNFGKARWSNIVDTILKQSNNKDFDINSSISRIGLTIDNGYQSKLDSVIKDASIDIDSNRASAVIICNKTGDILAESSWLNGEEWEFSPVFFGKIQPGSTFKTFAYLAALESGFSPSLILDSSPYKSTLYKNQNGDFWSVRNYKNLYRGKISLFNALATSDNTAFARLSELIDHKKIREVYQKFNLLDDGIFNPAIVLGGLSQGITLLKLASAYSVIASCGVLKSNRIVKFIQLDNGEFVSFKDNTETILHKDYSDLYDLKLALKYSAINLSKYGFSGKTGTTKYGSLFAGYNNDVSIAIWLGHRSEQVEDYRKGASGLVVMERWVQKNILGHKLDVFSI